MSTNNEINDIISNYQKQFQNILRQKFIDESLLLGLVNFVQPKFQNWILTEVHETATSRNASDAGHEATTNDIEFQSISYIEKIWYEFHYPIIKYFQNQHSSIKGMPTKFNHKNNERAVRRNVEMRKVNGIFLKFNKQTYSFYTNLLKHFLTRFKNNLIPTKALDYFQFEVLEQATEIDGELQANLICLAHRCILYLGDLSRHRSFITLNYTSTKNDSYQKSIELYELCIMILPGLSEPYNHLGVIYNLRNSRMNSIYYFIRSSLTRINSKLSISNLNSILSKNYTLHEEFLSLSKSNNFNSLKNLKTKSNSDFISDKDTLLKISSNFYKVLFSSYYNNEPDLHIDGKVYSRTKIEKTFFVCFSKLDLNEIEVYELVFKQLIISIGGFTLIKDKTSDCGKDTNLDKLKNFMLTFSSHLIEISTNNFKQNVENENLKENFYNLSLMRILLNWFKEEKFILQSFHKNVTLVGKLTTYLNSLIEFLKVESDYVESLKESTRVNDKDYYLINFEETFIKNISKRPTRSYFFDEDIKLKDFQSINYQLKDFNDNSIFKQSNSIDLLNGQVDPSEKLSITAENWSRINSILVLGKKLIDRNSVGFEFNIFEVRFSSTRSMEKQLQQKPEEIKKYTKTLKKQDKSDQKLTEVEFKDQYANNLLSLINDNGDSKTKKDTKEKHVSIHEEEKQGFEKIMSIVVGTKETNSDNRKSLLEQSVEAGGSFGDNKFKTLGEIENQILSSRSQKQEDKFKFEEMVDSLTSDESVSISQKITQNRSVSSMSSIWKTSNSRQGASSDINSSYSTNYQSFRDLSSNNTSLNSNSHPHGVQNNQHSRFDSYNQIGSYSPYFNPSQPAPTNHVSASPINFMDPNFNRMMNMNPINPLGMGPMNSTQGLIFNQSPFQQVQGPPISQYDYVQSGPPPASVNVPAYSSQSSDSQPHGSQFLFRGAPYNGKTGS